MKPVTTLRDGLHAKVLIARNIENFIATDAFEKAYNASNESEKSLINDLIEALNHAQLVKLIEALLNASRILEEMAVVELRLLCSRYGVKGYRHLTRQSLIMAVKRAQENHNASQGSGVARRDACVVS